MSQENHEVILPVILCDDHAITRTGLQTLLAKANIPVAGSCGTVQELLALVRIHPTAIVLTDLGVDNTQFTSLMDLLRAESPTLHIVVVSGKETPITMGLVYEAGATAFVPKSADESEIITALKFASVGELYFPPSVASAVFTLNKGRKDVLSSLSDREKEIFLAYCKTPSADTVGETLGLAPKTVYNILTQIAKKLDAPRSTFRDLAEKHGLLTY